MKDLFGDIYDIFKPHFEKFEKMHEELKQDIKRGIIEDLMNCTTLDAVAEIEARDEEFIALWPELLVHVESARNRLRNVILTYKDILGLEMLN